MFTVNKLGKMLIRGFVGALCACVFVGAIATANAAKAFDPIASYRNARNAIGSSLPVFNSSNPPAADLTDFYGQTAEIAGRITGRITMSDSNLLILDIGGQSETVSFPAKADQDWLNPGAVVRMLVAIPLENDYDKVHGVLSMLIAAPDSAVAEADDVEQRAILAAKAARDAQLARQAELQRGNSDARRLSSRSARYDFRGLAVGHPVAPLSPGVLSIYPAYRAAVQKLNPRLSSNYVDAITTSILYYSEKERIDPRLIMAMIIAESGFNPAERSRSGAMGLGQLMPGTAAGLGVTNAFDPVQNIGAAVHILSGHVRQYGGAPNGVVPLNTLMLTMAAYNAGSGAVRRYGGIPPYSETQRYVRKVAKLYGQMCGGQMQSVTEAISE